VLKILVVDDHELLRKQVCSLLESHPEFKVVCEASNGLEAIRHAGELQPDVVILDITMPVLGGIEAAVRIRGVAPKTRIIFLSQYNSGSIAQTALATGALAYVVKSAVSTDLIPAVQSVVEGKTFLNKLD